MIYTVMIILTGIRRTTCIITMGFISLGVRIKHLRRCCITFFSTGLGMETVLVLFLIKRLCRILQLLTLCLFVLLLYVLTFQLLFGSMEGDRISSWLIVHSFKQVSHE